MIFSMLITISSLLKVARTASQSRLVYLDSLCTYFILVHTKTNRTACERQRLLNTGAYRQTTILIY